MSSRHKHFYEFGSYRLDAANRQLLRNDRTVPLQPKAVDTLLLLVERRGEVLTKDELMQKLWPDSFVEESNLSQNIYVLRKALGQENKQEFIKTVPKRGYRFVADVREVGDADDAELIVEEHTQTRLTITQEEEQQQEQQSTAHVVPHQDATLIESRANLARGTHALFSSGRQALALAVGGLLLCGLAALVYIRLARPRPAAARPHTIAILPFKRLSPNEGDEYLGVGLCDVLITKLSNLHQLVVRPTSAVLKFEGAGTESIAAGRELQVESVLEGSLQRDGDRLRVTVRLLHVADGAPLWAGTFDESYNDIFKVQDSISERVAQALALRLSTEEKQRVAKRYTDNVEAHELYLKGRYVMAKLPEDGLRKAIEYFRNAIEIDPGNAQAYAGLAEVYDTLGGPLGYVSPKEAGPQAKAAVMKALELDETLDDAHHVLADLKLFYDWDLPGAEREFKRTLELNPNHVFAHDGYGTFLEVTGRFDEAVAERERSRQLDPSSPFIVADAGYPLYFARRYDQALEHYRQALELDPDFSWGHLWVGEVYMQKGMYEEAVAEINRAIALSGGDSRALATLGYAQAVAGRRREALKVLDELRERARMKYVSPYFIALIYTGLGEKDEAFAWLEKAYEERHPYLIHLKVDPVFDGLRSDPRFAELLARVGLAS